MNQQHHTIVSAEERATPPSEGWVRSVCGFGTGSKTCRYLSMGGAGFSCEKHSPMRAVIDQRVTERTMNAMGDNCSGRAMR